MIVFLFSSVIHPMFGASRRPQPVWHSEFDRWNCSEPAVPREHPIGPDTGLFSDHRRLRVWRMAGGFGKLLQIHFYPDGGRTHDAEETAHRRPVESKRSKALRTHHPGVTPYFAPSVSPPPERRPPRLKKAPGGFFTPEASRPGGIFFFRTSASISRCDCLSTPEWASFPPGVFAVNVSRAIAPFFRLFLF